MLTTCPSPSTTGSDSQLNHYVLESKFWQETRIYIVSVVFLYEIDKFNLSCSSARQIHQKFSIKKLSQYSNRETQFEGKVAS